MGRKSRIEAVAYLRTSSASNVGADKDSDRRQREAIASFARHAGFTVIEEFYDAAVSGADPIDTRPGFRALLERIVGNGVRIVIVEDASRFARTLMVQEAGIATLAGLGVQVLTSRGDDLTDSDDEMRVAMRQIAGVFSQLEKTRLVKKLKAARDRKSQTRGARVEGRPALPPLQERFPEAVALAKRLRRANPKTGRRMSFRKIAVELAKAGHTITGAYRAKGKGRQKRTDRTAGESRPFNPATVKAMTESPRPTKLRGSAPDTTKS